MQALPFIEVVKSIYGKWDGMPDKACEEMRWINLIEKFYSKPFDIRMIINPIECPEYEAWTKGDKKFNEATEKFLEAEDKKLFKDLFIAGKNLDYGKGVTLNDFISDYHRAGIKLHWKQSIVDKYFNQTK